MAEDTARPQRRRPTIAKDWQLAVLRKLQSESGNPTGEQRLAAAVETGLDEKWVKNWFIRQRSKLAARNRKTAQVPTFKVQAYHDVSSCRSVSTPVDPPPPCLPSPASPASRSPCPPLPSTMDTHWTIPRSQRSVSAPLSPSDTPSFVPHTTTIPTYSRDPLCNRYPDFSQFFRPRVHERFHTFQLLAPISHHNHHPVQLDPHSPMHPQSLAYALGHGGLPTDQTSWTNPQPSPVAFSVRLVDLLDHSSLTRYPALPPPGSGYRI